MMNGVEKIAVANTFVKKWEYENYVDSAIKLGYKVVVIICKGEFTSIHNIPDAKVQQMLANFEY